MSESFISTFLHPQVNKRGSNFKEKGVNLRSYLKWGWVMLSRGRAACGVRTSNKIKWTYFHFLRHTSFYVCYFISVPQILDTLTRICPLVKRKVRWTKWKYYEWYELYIGCKEWKWTLYFSYQSEIKLLILNFRIPRLSFRRTALSLKSFIFMFVRVYSSIQS